MVAACVFPLAASAPAFAQNLPVGFLHEALVGEPFTGAPVGFAFLPDGRFLLIERQTGAVRIATLADSVSTVIATIPDVEADHPERGLLGVAVDPDWPARPYVYFQSTQTDAKTHVTMYTATGDLSDPVSSSMGLTSPYSLLDDIPDLAGNHNGGTLRFGPDDMLYVGLGDDAGACGAQDLSSYRGKILRLDVSTMPGAGSGPPPKADVTPSDNPFAGPSEIARLVFAWGLRNPFRFTIDDATGDVFLGDVGQNDFEEIDVAPAGGPSGPNFGWPLYEGNLRLDQFTCGLGNLLTTPIHTIPHAGGVISVIGGPVVRGNPSSPMSFPASYDGNYFFFEIFSGKLTRLARGSTGWALAPPVEGQPAADRWADGLDGVADAQWGSDGALYFTTIDVPVGTPRGLHRITVDSAFVGTPLPPAPGGPGLHVFPNPSRPGSGTTIRPRFDTPASTLHVHDSTGRLVRTLGAKPGAGAPLFVWDGRTRAGADAPAGLYFFRLDSETGPKGRGKVTLLR